MVTTGAAQSIWYHGCKLRVTLWVSDVTSYTDMRNATTSCNEMTDGLRQLQHISGRIQHIQVHSSIGLVSNRISSLSSRTPSHAVIYSHPDATSPTLNHSHSHHRHRHHPCCPPSPRVDPPSTPPQQPPLQSRRLQPLHPPHPVSHPPLLP